MDMGTPALMRKARVGDHWCKIGILLWSARPQGSRSIQIPGRIAKSRLTDCDAYETSLMGGRLLTAGAIQIYLCCEDAPFVEHHVELAGIAKDGIRLRLPAAIYGDPSDMMHLRMHCLSNGDPLTTHPMTRLLAWSGVGVIVFSVAMLHKTD